MNNEAWRVAWIPARGGAAPKSRPHISTNKYQLGYAAAWKEKRLKSLHSKRVAKLSTETRAGFGIASNNALGR